MSEIKEIDGVMYRITPVHIITQEELDNFKQDKLDLQSELLSYPEQCSDILKKVIDNHNEQISNSILYIDNILIENDSYL